MGACSSIWEVNIRPNHPDKPVVNVDGIAKANIATVKDVPIANVHAINGIMMSEVTWQVTVTA